ncbi:MAG: hypothetical protein K2K73_01345, partial [Ureaplasma sp.]|nr:hypothetical protein [Ureaplasma sp.]
MTKRKKIITICLSATGLTIVPSVVVASVVTNDETFSNKENLKNNNTASKYSFFDYNFNTKDEIIEYVTSSANVNSRMSKTPYRWTLNVNNKLVTFDNQEELFNYLNNFIETKSYTSYTNSFKTSQDGDEDDLKTDANGALLPSELSKMNFNENVKTQRVYRGKNNSIHLTEKEAKDTYFEKHEVYYFNGIFFRTKEELSVWLEQNMNNLTDSEVYEITFQNIAGNNSIPINVEKLKADILLSKETNKIPNVIDNFVRSNNKSFIEYKSALQPNTKKYISSEHVDEIHDYEANYVQLISNQGKGNYIIDTSTEDTADLIGPYYVKSGTEILQITDKSKWKKVSGNDYHVVNEMLQKELICKFMNLILATPPNDPLNPEYNESNIEPSKNALYTIPEIQKEINEYFDDLCNNFPNVYKSIQSLYNTMKQGKKFGEFLKTPVLFVHTIDQIIYYNGSQEFIDKTRDIYSKICDHFDKLIYSTIPKTFLKANNGTYFTTKDLFKVDN